MRRIGALLSSVCLAAFVIGLSPHLVHHVTEDHRASDECPFAASAERAPAAAASIHVVAKPLPQPDGSTVSGQVALPRPARLAAGARPPLPPPSSPNTASTPRPAGLRRARRHVSPASSRTVVVHLRDDQERRRHACSGYRSTRRRARTARSSPADGRCTGGRQRGDRGVEAGGETASGTAPEARGDAGPARAAADRARRHSGPGTSRRAAPQRAGDPARARTSLRNPRPVETRGVRVQIQRLLLRLGVVQLAHSDGARVRRWRAGAGRPREPQLPLRQVLLRCRENVRPVALGRGRSRSGKPPRPTHGGPTFGCPSSSEFCFERFGAEEAETEIELHRFNITGVAPLGNGLSISFGRFDTPFGIERHDPNLLLTATTSEVFQFGRPNSMTGFQLSYQFAPWLDATAWVANRWENETTHDPFDDNNRAKSFGGRLGFTPLPTGGQLLNIGLGGWWGEEQTDDTANPRWFVDLDVTWSPLPRLILAAEAVYGGEEGVSFRRRGVPFGAAEARDRDVTWWGLYALVHYDIVDWLGLTFRYGFFRDEHAARTGIRQSLQSFTVAPVLHLSRLIPDLRPLGVAYPRTAHPLNWVDVKLEYRANNSNRPVFSDAAPNVPILGADHWSHQHRRVGGHASAYSSSRICRRLAWYSSSVMRRWSWSRFSS